MNSALHSCLDSKVESSQPADLNGQEVDERIAFVSASVLDMVYDPIRSELTRLRKSAASELALNSKKLFKRQDRFIAISINDEESSPSLYGTPIEKPK